MISKIGCALSGHLSAEHAATLDTRATSITEDRLASQLSKWWHIEPYPKTVTGNSKDEKRATKTLEQTTCER